MMPSSPQTREETGRVTTLQKRVLIAEDDPEVLMLETRILENAGYVVEGVGSGDAALERLSQNRYCAVVADVMMPKMDGFELTREIRKRFGKTIPVVLVTAIQDPLVAAHEQDAKPIAAIEKPFLSKSLVATVMMLEEQAEAARNKPAVEGTGKKSKSWLRRLLEPLSR
jgi:CheY-like chemotaxis protein